MDLWIRSQDRKNLLKCDDIAVNGRCVVGYFDRNIIYERDLGLYGTRKRALEVLDEIQNAIYTEVKSNNTTYEQADIEIKSNILCNMSKIYVMPKE